MLPAPRWVYNDPAMPLSLISIPVFPQDPTTTPTPERVKVGGELLPGPVGKRVAVFDYNRDRDEVYHAARPRRDGSFPDYDPADLRFHQLNAYAITARAVELVELELGRDLRWGFDASRLIVLPHAGYLANAFYSEDTHSLQLFSFRSFRAAGCAASHAPNRVASRAAGRGRERPGRGSGKRAGGRGGGPGAIYHTSLSHDIVAHETGHAILDAVRDRYTEALEPETSALHEAIGDLTALFAALSYETVRRRVARRLARPNLVTEIAEDFEGAHRNLRSLLGSPRRDWGGELEPHRLSLKLTRAVYAALIAMAALERRRGAKPLTALKDARRALQRMVVRSLDFLPPADATLEEFGLAMLASDRLAHPDDTRGYRAVTAAVLRKHFVLSRRGAHGGRDGRHGLDTPADLDTRPWRSLPRSWPRPTWREAYLFLDANRDRLVLGRYPDYRDFIVRDLQIAAQAKDPTQVGQVVLVYEYPVEVRLAGREFGPAHDQWITFWGGGTLVFDPEGRLYHHAAKPVTRQRVGRGLEFLRAQMDGGAVATIGGSRDDQLRRERVEESWTLALAADGATLRRNPAVRCVGPPGEVTMRAGAAATRARARRPARGAPRRPTRGKPR
jgi:hypothetical protein